VSEPILRYERHSDWEDATVNNRDTVILVLTVLAAIILPGLANWGFSTLGYPWVGSAVWALGYGLGVVFIWYEWVRPLDITGPEGVSGSEDSSE
jgi:fatty acid desaturase